MATRLWLMIAAMALATPAAAQTDEAAFVGEMRQFADMTAGQGGPADKLLYFGRDQTGELVVTAIMALAPGAAWGTPPPSEHPIVAVMRFRGSRPGHDRRPDPADIAYARTSGVPVFLVGEWARPALVWEVVWLDGQARIRTVDRQGHPGPWQIPAS